MPATSGLGKRLIVVQSRQVAGSPGSTTLNAIVAWGATDGTSVVNTSLVINPTTGAFSYSANVPVFNFSGGTALFGNSANNNSLKVSRITTNPSYVQLQANSNNPNLDFSSNLTWGQNGGSPLGSFTTTGNLLVGGTTDITGSGGLKVFGTTDATNSTSGAFQCAGGGSVQKAFVVGTTLTTGAITVTNSGTSTFGAGGTGAGIARLTLNAGSAAGGIPSIAFTQNAGGGYSGYVGVASQANDLATGSTAGRLVLRGQTGVDISSNDGVAIGLKLDSSNNTTLAGTLTVSGTGTSSFAGPVQLRGYTVATLPASPGTGATAYVTDSNTTITAGIGAVVAGGGTNVVPVFFDGTSWRIY